MGAIKNSGGNLCLHITGALNHFIGALLGGSGYVRHYDDEFILKGISKQQLVDNLEKTKVVVADTLNQLTVEDLNKVYPKKWQEEEVPAYWFLSHLLTHINYHLGQINYHRRMINPS
jgi:uncharacterized damage-inducible protein DinB